jgi:hypothetical protein
MRLKHEEFPIYLGIGELIEMSRHESGGVFNECLNA